MIRLRYFASLREHLGIGDEQIDLPAGVADVSGLAGWLQQRDTTWRSALEDPGLRVAVNQVIAGPECPVRDGDEIAWFPPVTGG